MNNLYIARQPIFDKRMKLFGYELLYRKSQNNFFEGTDDDHATAELLDNSFFIGFRDLVESTRGFINFPKQLLLDEIPFMLPSDRTVIEVLERVEIDDAIIQVCHKLKKMGYKLALDDFIVSEETKSYAPLLEFVDIIKLEYDPGACDDHVRLIRKYSPRITFLAERLETAEDYKHAVEMGFKLFQGFFFSKPVMIKAKDIGSLDINLTLILKELHRPEPDFKAMASLFERDLGLSYKLLRMANSVYYGVQYRVSSIQQALMRLGTQAIISWVHLMMIKGLQNAENAELVKASLIRGKVLALMALQAHRPHHESDYFITGIFSSVDVLLHEDMRTVVDRLPLAREIKDALTGKDNDLRRALVSVLDFERASWDNMDALLCELRLTRSVFMSLYIEAIKWQSALAVA